MLPVASFSISEVPLSQSISGSNKTLKFHERKVFTPFWDESGKLLCLEDEELGIDVCAYTREELEKELIIELDFLWHEYALAKDSTLSPQAITLKHKLLDCLEEINK